MTSDVSIDCPLAGVLAARLRVAKRELVTQWLERIVARVSIDPNRVFPTDHLLDHVPLLIDGIADYLESPSAEVANDTPVIGKAMELGALRHSQGFDAYEVLKEYEILGGILFHYLAQQADTLPDPCERSELLYCGQRLFRAVAIIQQVTTTHFLRLADERVAKREERLRTFNQAVSHEIKNRIGAILGAGGTLQEIADMAPEQRARFHAIITDNARAMQNAVQNILEVSRTERGDVRQHRHVRLPAVVQEATRQLRELAMASRVELRIASPLPDIEVDAAAVELCLTNYLSNAIKYADHEGQHAFAEISAVLEQDQPGSGEVVVRVSDNGRGVPDSKRGRLFQRFFRAHTTVTEVEGTGLGLSIVRDTAEALGGRAWAEFPEKGAVFAFSLPARRGSGADRRAQPSDGG